MIWYKFFLADYIKDTHHLADAEDLAYRRLIDMYYMTEKPIPLDVPMVARKIRLDLDVVELVLREFFDKQEDGYHNSRCDRELGKYQHQVRVNQQLNDRRWQAKKSQSESESDSQSGANRVPNQISDIRKNIKNTSSAKPTRFDDFWLTWPASKRKVAKATCQAKWERQNLDAVADRILAHVEGMKGTDQWREGFEPAPLTYINQKRWEDDAPQLIRRAK